MSVGFVLASEADFAGARDIAAGFGLDAIGPATLGGQDATVRALQNAANVGIILSPEAARDAAFVALLRALSASLRSAQLILSTPDARGAFPLLPEAWPSMSLADAIARAADLTRRRNAPLEPSEPPHAHPLPPIEAPAQAPPEPHIPERADEDEVTPSEQQSAPNEDTESGADENAVLSDHVDANPELDDGSSGGKPHSFGGDAEPTPPEGTETAAPPNDLPGAPPQAEPTPAEAAPNEQEGGPLVNYAVRHQRPPALRASDSSDVRALLVDADATAFAPRRLRAAEADIIRITIHQPKDRAQVLRAARSSDPRTAAAAGVGLGALALGAPIGVTLEAEGALCHGEKQQHPDMQRLPWKGAPLDFVFTTMPRPGIKQVAFVARVFIDDAQIGVMAFTRRVTKAKQQAPFGDGVRLKRHKRVFLSYSSKDRETVAAIATAYQAAGVEHFFDRTSLKSGEEWNPRLRREIDRADLFHLCWSKAAAASEWVEKEAEHALTRRRRGKKPDITVQMLDGPPWAPHPPHLDSINFDDFVRAAVVGYARGDGGA